MPEIKTIIYNIQKGIFETFVYYILLSKIYLL